MMIVLFGRAGAGKTTIAKVVIKMIQYNNDSHNSIIHHDLDDYIPDWMKTNFIKGIYPTVSQRALFIEGACDRISLVKDHPVNVTAAAAATESSVVVVSFSFVNDDIRIIYRRRFPNAIWILVDVNDDLASERILMRRGHFYKRVCEIEGGDEYSNANAETKNDDDDDDDDNDDDDDDDDDDDGRKEDEWDFQEVPFDHVILNGEESVEVNARRVVDLICQCRKKRGIYAVDSIPSNARS